MRGQYANCSCVQCLQNTRWFRRIDPYQSCEPAGSRCKDCHIERMSIERPVLDVDYDKVKSEVAKNLNGMRRRTFDKGPNKTFAL